MKTRTNTRTNIRHFVVTAILMLLVGAFTMTAQAKGLSDKKIQIEKGKTYQLSVSGYGKAKVTWKSSKKSVATVTSKGKVKAVGTGSAKITAKVSKKTYTCKVTVVKKAQAGSVSSNKDVSVNAVNPSGMSSQEAANYRKLQSLRTRFCEGRAWDNSVYYAWNGGIFAGGYGCAGFAFLMSDQIFGNAKAVQHTNFNKIKVGDIVRCDYNTHSVIVLSVEGSQITVAEGNYGSTIHWGRQIPISELYETGTYVMTRYA